MDVLPSVLLILIINSAITEKLVRAQESKRIVATVGQSVDLTCETPSGQQAVWYRNERPLNNGSTRVITRDTLTIMDTNLRDSGRYTCIDPAQTPTSLFSRDFSLVILRSTVIVTPPAALSNIAAGAKVTYGCISEGSPPPFVIWTINNSVEIAPEIVSPVGSTSFVDITATPGDTEITCTIYPPTGGPISKTVNMFVASAPYNGTSAVNEFSNTVVANDALTTFSCLVPPIMNTTSIQWIRDGMELDGENNNELTMNPSVTGVYCCEVNGITVHCAYIYVQRRPRISNASPSISTVTGRSVSLYCEASGEEPPILVWLYGNRTLVMNSSNTLIHNNIVEVSHLTIANVQAENQELEFICAATNSLNVVEREIVITSVGSCANNMLTTPSGADNEWVVPGSQSFIPSDSFGESVFQISYQNLIGRSESITHDIQVNSSVVALHFRAQVRYNDDDVVNQRVCLIVINKSVTECATNALDDRFNERLDGWQWIEGTLNLTAALGISEDDLTSNTLRVELYADKTGLPNPSSGEVFFDNICVEATFRTVIVPEASEVSDDDNDNTITIIIGASVGGALLLALLLILLIMCCCICCRKNKVKVGRFRKQSIETIRRNTTQPQSTNVNAIRYHPNPKKTDSLEYQYNYVAPNKVGSNTEIYGDGEAGFYVKLDGTQNQQVNHYQSTSVKSNDVGNHATELYDEIDTEDQPQYEVLPGEAGEVDQYLTVMPNNEDDETSEMTYLDVLPSHDHQEEIYSDISDSIKQYALENNQEVEIDN